MPAPVAEAPLSGQAVKWNCFTTRDLLSVHYRMVVVCAVGVEYNHGAVTIETQSSPQGQEKVPNHK